MKLEVKRLIELVDQELPLMNDCGKIKIEPLFIQTETHYFDSAAETTLAHIVPADVKVNISDKLTIVSAYVQERDTGGRTNPRKYAEPKDYVSDKVVNEAIEGYLTLSPLERVLRHGDPTHIDLVLVVALRGSIVGSITMHCPDSLVTEIDWMRVNLGITADFYIDHKVAYIGYINGKPYHNNIVFTLSDDQALLELGDYLSELRVVAKQARNNGYTIVSITDPFPRLTVEHFEKLASLGARFPKANSQPLRTV